MSADRTDRFVRRVPQFPQRTTENRPGPTDSAKAVDDHAFPPPHAFGHQVARRQDAIALEGRLARQAAADEILEHDLVSGERARVVVARMETNHATESPPTERCPVGFGPEPQGVAANP